LSSVNLVFIIIFAIEFLMKFVALECKYFKLPWNVFDFIILMLCLCELIFEKIIKTYLVVSPTILKSVRVLRVGRILRLIEVTRGIRALLFALVVSLPALVNIGLLLFLVIFIYSIFGMNLFMYVGYTESLNAQFNFETTFSSFVTLFPLCTSAGWNTLLEALTHTDQPKCDPNMITGSYISKGNCGNTIVAIIFLVSYLIITFLVMINMYIAIILENFNNAKEEVQQGLTTDDYDMFYDLWQKFDPGNTEFIAYGKLSEFIDSLQKPLRIPRPNKYEIILLNIPISGNDLVYCVDILDALTRRLLQLSNLSNEEFPTISEDCKQEIKEKPKNYKPYTTTLNKQRLVYSANVIKRAYKKYLTEKK
jgi:hypothetical protein